VSDYRTGDVAISPGEGGTRLMCRKCGDIIRSVHRHDFRKCVCGAIFVDGGNDYLRLGGDLDAVLIEKKLGQFTPLEV